MLIRERKLRSIIRALLEAKKDNPVFDPASVDIPVHRRIEKLFEPGQDPVKKAKFDLEIDTQGTPKQKAFALAAKAFSYADNDEKEALKVLNMARMTHGRIKKDVEKNTESPEDAESSEALGDTGLIDKLVTKVEK